LTIDSEAIEACQKTLDYAWLSKNPRQTYNLPDADLFAGKSFFPLLIQN
jgi:hypothetical protein